MDGASTARGLRSWRALARHNQAMGKRWCIWSPARCLCRVCNMGTPEINYNAGWRRAPLQSLAAHLPTHVGRERCRAGQGRSEPLVQDPPPPSHRPGAGVCRTPDNRCLPRVTPTSWCASSVLSQYHLGRLRIKVRWDERGSHVDIQTGARVQVYPDLS